MNGGVNNSRGIIYFILLTNPLTIVGNLLYLLYFYL